MEVLQSVPLLLLVVVPAWGREELRLKVDRMLAAPHPVDPGFAPRQVRPRGVVSWPLW